MEGKKVNQISEYDRFQIGLLRMLGKSFNEIAEQTSHSKVTVQHVCADIVKNIDDRPEPRKNIPKPLRCDNCLIREVNPNSEFFRSSRRTKHKFCSTVCYGEYRTKLRSEDRCSRCDVRKGDLRPGRNGFVRGFCQKCYGLLLEYNFDFDMADVHELNQNLKKAAKDGN